jgi:hypothetical protein
MHKYIGVVLTLYQVINAHFATTCRDSFYCAGK